MSKPIKEVSKYLYFRLLRFFPQYHRRLCHTQVFGEVTLQQVKERVHNDLEHLLSIKYFQALADEYHSPHRHMSVNMLLCPIYYT